MLGSKSGWEAWAIMRQSRSGHAGESSRKYLVECREASLVGNFIVVV